MQYSSTSEKNGIIQMEETLCRLGDGGISGNTTLLKQFCGYNNLAYREVWAAIMSVDKTFLADDWSWSDYPEGPITTVVGQRSYTLPLAFDGADYSTFLRVNKIWIADASGNRTELTRMDDDEEFTYTNGYPTKYRLHGNSLMLNIPPNASAVTLYVLVQRVPDYFEYDFTTEQPSFIGTYHDLIPLKASALFLLPTEPALSTLYEGRFLQRMELLKRDIVLRDTHTPRRIAVANHSNR
jgi:hypothetical protein